MQELRISTCSTVAAILLASGMTYAKSEQAMPNCSFAPKKYTVVTLPLTFANAVNFFSKVVGDGVNSQGTQHAFSYFKGKATDLGSFSISGVDPTLAPSNANAVNITGLVVGDATNPGIYTHAALFANGKVTDLGTLGGFNSSATGVNISGTIVGYSDTSTTDLSTQHAFVKASSKLKDLGTLAGTGSSQAFAINDLGSIVGQSAVASGDVHGFFYKGGKLVDVGTLGGSTSAVVAINDLDIAVGSANLSGDADFHAIAYYRGHLIDLGVLNSGDSSATAINDLLEVVGASGYNSPTNDVRAVTFVNGKFVDLNTLIDPKLGIFLSNAVSINDRGEIVAQGTDATGAFANFLLEPSK